MDEDNDQAVCKYCLLSQFELDLDNTLINPCKCTNPICRECFSRQILFNKNNQCEICDSVLNMPVNKSYGAYMCHNIWEIYDLFLNVSTNESIDELIGKSQLIVSVPANDLPSKVSNVPVNDLSLEVSNVPANVSVNDLSLKISNVPANVPANVPVNYSYMSYIRHNICEIYKSVSNIFIDNDENQSTDFHYKYLKYKTKYLSMRNSCA
jgi:hypothetical protein